MGVYFAYVIMFIGTVLSVATVYLSVYLEDNSDIKHVEGMMGFRH